MARRPRALSKSNLFHLITPFPHAGKCSPLTRQPSPSIRNLAHSLIDHVTVAQNSLGAGQTVNGQSLVVGQGLTASTSILNTGFGFNFFPYLHIGATSWYLMGARAKNPLHL